MPRKKSQERPTLTYEEFKCRFCDRTFNSREMLEDHLEEAHEEEFERQGERQIWSRPS